MRTGPILWITLLLSTAWAQLPQTSSGQPAAASPLVPHLVRFSGAIKKDDAGRSLPGVVNITFVLYNEGQGGAPLWIETQAVRVDSNGRYSVMLGTTSVDGLPTDLFTSGEARWLGVQPEGQPEQPRVLLLSVPYALKAADAATLGGLPPSAFLLAPPAGANSATSSSGEPQATATSTTPSALSVTTTGGTINTLPLFTTSTNIQNSALTQTGTGPTAKIGIGTTTPSATLDVKGAATIEGTLTAPATGLATASGGKSSQVQNLVASSFNSSTASAVNQTFQWKAEPAGNNTSAPSGTLNLLFGSGTAAPKETGLKLSNKGLFTFATGQTFPGAGTITGVTTGTGSGLTGGGNSGSLTLSLLKTCTTNQILQWSGTAWVCATGSGSGTVTSVGLSAPSSDFTVSGSPITGSGTLSLNWTAAPTSNDTANTIVKRDGSGNFAANTITAGSLGGGALNTTTGNITTLTAGTISAASATISSSLLMNSAAGVPLFVSSSAGNATVIEGAASATTGGAWGVEGVTSSSSSTAYGVYGLASASAGSPKGVYGQASSLNGIGVFGQNGTLSSTGGTISAISLGAWGDGGAAGGWGVIGTADDGYAGAFTNSTPFYSSLIAQNNDISGSPFYAFNNANGSYCYVDSVGDLNCSGSKNAVVPIDGGQRKVAMSAIESPKNWFEDAGSAELVNGSAVVALDPDFIQTVNTEREYLVFPVPNGDCKGLYVSHQTGTSFEVHELGGGSSSVHFYYRIMALRKNYEDVRFADHTNDPDPRKMTKHGQPANLKTNPMSTKSAFPLESRSRFNPADGTRP